MERLSKVKEGGRRDLMVAERRRKLRQEMKKVTG